MMDRRAFIGVVGGSILAAPLSAEAQESGKAYRIGWLSLVPRIEPSNMAFEQRLRELGFAEWRNLVIEFRTAQGRIETLPELAADLARHNCDVGDRSESCRDRAGEPRHAHCHGCARLRSRRHRPYRQLGTPWRPDYRHHPYSIRTAGKAGGVANRIAAERTENRRPCRFHQHRPTRGRRERCKAEFKRAPYDYDKAFAEAVRAKAQAQLALGSANFVPARRQITELARIVCPRCSTIPCGRSLVGCCLTDQTS